MNICLLPKQRKMIIKNIIKASEIFSLSKNKSFIQTIQNNILLENIFANEKYKVCKYCNGTGNLNEENKNTICEITNIQIIYVLQEIKRIYEKHKLAKYKQIAFLVTLKSFLRYKLIQDDVCEYCCGTGGHGKFNNDNNNNNNELIGDYLKNE